MINFIETYNTREIISSSILLLVDNVTMSYNIKWIDFGRVYDLEDNKKDTNILFGFKKLRWLLKELPFLG